MIERVVQNALSKDPRMRPRDARAFGAELRQAASAGGIDLGVPSVRPSAAEHAPTLPAPEPARRGAGGSAWMGVAVLAGAVSVGVAWYALGGGWRADHRMQVVEHAESALLARDWDVVLTDTDALLSDDDDDADALHIRQTAAAHLFEAAQHDYAHRHLEHAQDHCEEALRFDPDHAEAQRLLQRLGEENP